MKIGSYKIDPTTLGALIVLVLGGVFVWFTSSEPHREEILAVMLPVVATILASLPAMVRRAAPVLLACVLVPSLVGCGGSTAAGIAGVISVAKPVAIGICEAARFTERVCARHGAYGDETSGGETPAEPAAP